MSTRTTKIVSISNIEVEKVQQDNEQRESISLMGLRRPVELTPSKSNGMYRIIDGRRRILSLIQLGETEVEAFIQENTDDETLHLDAILYNSGKPNYGDEAEHIKYLIEVCGYTKEHVAEATGMSITTISNRVKLYEDLIPPFFEQLKGGELSQTVCNEILKLNTDRQEKLHTQYEEDEDKTAKNLRSKIQVLFTEARKNKSISDLAMSAPIVPPLIIQYNTVTSNEPIITEYQGKKIKITIEEL